jgi:hypothetical protein
MYPEELPSPPSNNAGFGGIMNFWSRARNQTRLLEGGLGSSSGYIISDMNHFIYERVKEYADKYLGKQWLVALPRSAIMERIRNGQNVPTQLFAPSIEYSTVETGWFGYSGIRLYHDDEEDDTIEQIEKSFRQNDNRYLAMALFDVYPSGHYGFYDDSTHQAKWHELPTDSFRPNKWDGGEDFPSQIWVACDVKQLARTPDFAVLSIANPIHLDFWNEGDQDSGYVSDWSLLELKRQFPDISNKYLNQLLKHNLVQQKKHMFGIDNPRVLDVKRAYIPLQSDWSRYGPWMKSDDFAGKSSIAVNEILAPWNYASGVTTMDEAGNEQIDRSVSTDYVTSNSVIQVDGFPTEKPFKKRGRNSYISSISCSFGINGITTTYRIATYSSIPGTYRKAEFDNISKLKYADKQLKQIYNWRPESIRSNNRWKLDRYSMYTGNRFV